MEQPQAIQTFLKNIFNSFSFSRIMEVKPSFIYPFIFLFILIRRSQSLTCCLQEEGDRQFKNCNSKNEITEIHPEGTDGVTACDFCYAELNLGTMQFKQGCGVYNQTEKIFPLNKKLDSCIWTKSESRKSLKKLPGVEPLPFFDGKEKIQCACKDKRTCNSRLITNHHFKMKIKASKEKKCCAKTKGTEKEAFTCKEEVDKCKYCILFHDPTQDNYAQHCIQDFAPDEKNEKSHEAAKKLFGELKGDVCTLHGGADDKAATIDLFLGTDPFDENTKAFTLCKCEGAFCNKHIALSKSNSSWQEPKEPTKQIKVPTKAPTKSPTEAPAEAPTKAPTKAPTGAPTKAPTGAPIEPSNNGKSVYQCRFSWAFFICAWITFKMIF